MSVNVAIMLKNQESKIKILDFFSKNQDIVNRLGFNREKRIFPVILLESNSLPYTQKSDLIVGFSISILPKYIFKLAVWIALKEGQADENGHQYILFDDEKMPINNKNTHETISADDLGIMISKKHPGFIHSFIRLINSKKDKNENLLMLELNDRWLKFNEELLIKNKVTIK